ncbi:MAG: aldose epimerase family protein [Ignavibacteria bacterium]|jgi:aldose 1-epimerase
MQRYLHKLFIFSLIIIITFCSTNQKNDMIERNLFGKLSDGRDVYVYSLKNDAGTQINIINYGAIVTHLFVKDKDGNTNDIVTGYDSIENYEKDDAFFGAIVGRYGNRIGKGKFQLDGTEYQLSINDGPNHLHGGVKGFNKVLWDAEPIENGSYPSLKLTYVSADGEEGYPGKVTLTAIYSLTNENELKIEYTGVTDKPTILNPTHHSYFNLSGDFSKTILNHELKINADKFTPVDETLITTGELVDVEGTPMDFREAKQIGTNINDDYDQLKFGKGYDHNWVLKNYDSTVRKVASLYDPSSGRLMEVLTDQPGLQFYSGNFLNGTKNGKNGYSYNHRTSLCLETQHYPDSPNKPEFPPVTLRPGETYKHTVIYKFSVKQ